MMMAKDFKATIDRSALSAAMAVLVKAVEKRSSIPILSCVLLRCEKAGHLELITTDLDHELVHALECDCTVGAVALDAKSLAALATKSDCASLVISQDDGKVSVDAGFAVHKLAGFPSDDFPSLKSCDGQPFDVDAKALARMLNLTSLCVSTDETRYYLNGVLFHHGPDGALRLAATDGHKLARGDVAAALPEFADSIVHRGAVDLLQAIIGKREGAVSLAFEDARMRADVGPWSLRSKLIDGTFPDYGRVIPSRFNHSASAPANEMAASIKAATVLATDHVRAVRMSVRADVVSFSYSGSEGGSSTSLVKGGSGSVNQGKGGEAGIGFNAAYLSGLLAAFGKHETMLAWEDAAAPTLISSEKGAPGFLFVLMPMRV